MSKKIKRGKDMNRLKEMREEKNLLQKNLADMLSVSQTCYSKYELEQREIPLLTILKIADFYKVSIDYIFYRTDIRKQLPLGKLYKTIKK